MNNLNTSNLTQQTPTIVSIAESTHYLVGVYDNANNLNGINNSDDIDCFTSLLEAKQFLRKNHIACANLEYQTAYDEMCGNPSVGSCSELIEL